MGTYGGGGGGSDSSDSSDSGRGGTYSGGGYGGGSSGGYGGSNSGNLPGGVGGSYADRGTGSLPGGVGGSYADRGGGNLPGGVGGLYADRGTSSATSNQDAATTSDTTSATDTGAAQVPTVNAGASDALAASAAGAGDPATTTDAPAAPDTGTQSDAATFTGDASGDVTGTPPAADQVAVSNLLSSPTGPDVPGSQAEAATGAAPTAAGPAGPGAVASGAGAGQDDLLSISGADPLAQDQGAAFDPTQTQTIVGQAPPGAIDTGLTSGQPTADQALSQPQDTTDQLQLDPVAAYRNVGSAPGVNPNTGGVYGSLSGIADPTAGQDASTPADFTGLTYSGGAPINAELQQARAVALGNTMASGYGPAQDSQTVNMPSNSPQAFANSMKQEVGTGLQNTNQQTAYAEEVLNRAAARGMSVDQTLIGEQQPGQVLPGGLSGMTPAGQVGYYPSVTSHSLDNPVSASTAQQGAGAWNAAVLGSNVANVGTGNASGGLANRGSGFDTGTPTADFRGLAGTQEAFGVERNSADIAFANAINSGLGTSGLTSNFTNGVQTSGPSTMGPTGDNPNYFSDTQPSQPDNPATGIGTIGPSQFASAGSMLTSGADASIADTPPTSAASAGSMLLGQTGDFLADPNGSTTDPLSANFQTEFGPPAPGTAPLDPTTAFPGNVSAPPGDYGAPQFDQSQTAVTAPGALAPVNAPAPNTPGGAITWDDFLEQQRQLAANMPAGPDPLAYGAPQFDPNQTQTSPPAALGAPFSQPGPVGGMGINIGQAFNSAQTQAAADRALQDLLQQGPSPAPGGMPALPAPGTSAIPFAPQPTGGMGINLPSLPSVMDNPPSPARADAFMTGAGFDPNLFQAPYGAQAPPAPPASAPDQQFDQPTPDQPAPTPPPLQTQLQIPMPRSAPGYSPPATVNMPSSVVDIPSAVQYAQSLRPGTTVNTPVGPVVVPDYGQPIVNPQTGETLGYMPNAPSKYNYAGPTPTYGVTNPDGTPVMITPQPSSGDPLAPPGSNSSLAPGGAPSAAGSPQTRAAAGGGGGDTAGSGGATGGGAQGAGGRQFAPQQITPAVIQQTIQTAAASSPQVAAAADNLSAAAQLQVTTLNQDLLNQWRQALLSQGVLDPAQSPAWPQVQAIIQQQTNQLILQLGGTPVAQAA